MKYIVLFILNVLLLLLITFYMFIRPVIGFFFVQLLVFTFVSINTFLPEYYEKIFEKLEKKLHKVEQLDITDIINNKDYYRDALKRYSIGELYYIDVFEDNTKMFVILTLLMLINKKIIKIENNNIVILNYNSRYLSNSEWYVFYNIKNGKINLADVQNIQDIVKEESINDKLISLSKNKIRSLLFKILLIIELLLIIFTIYTNRVFVNGHEIFYAFIILVVLLNILLLIKIYNFNKEIYKRTEEGTIINNKLNGLKHFIKMFGKLDNKELQSIKLWDDYFIYSVMFKVNKKAYKEIEDIII